MFLIPIDLAPFADIPTPKALAMIEDAEAQAALIAPCIATLDAASVKYAAVRAILRGAVLRWHDAGNGAIVSTQQGAGPFQQAVTVDNTRQRRGAFWPSEIEQLQSVCKSDDAKGIFAIDTAPGSGSVHRPWCALAFGGAYCSCGADIAGEPIYEAG